MLRLCGSEVFEKPGLTLPLFDEHSKKKDEASREKERKGERVLQAYYHELIITDYLTDSLFPKSSKWSLFYSRVPTYSVYMSYMGRG